MDSDDTARAVTGTVTHEESGRPAVGLEVHARDDDLLVDDTLGTDTTDGDGRYRIEYTEAEYHDMVVESLDRVIEGTPDLYVEVRDDEGTVLASTEADPVREVGFETTIDVEIPGSGPVEGRPESGQDPPDEETPESGAEPSGNGTPGSGQETPDDGTSERDQGPPDGGTPEREQGPPDGGTDDGTGGYPTEYPGEGVEYLEDSDLIQLVKFSDPDIVVGEPVSVTVVLREGAHDGETMVAVNGVPGRTQTLQFSDPGPRRMHVAAFTMRDGRQTTIDQRTVTVDVGERDPAVSGESFRPVVRARQVPRDGLTVEFTVENAAEFDAEDPVYVWDIDGQQEVVTETPRLRHDFADQQDSESPFTNFDVGVQINSETGPASNLGRRSVGTWNRDYLNRARGVVELRMKGTPEVVREGERFTLSYELQNPADVRVDIDTRQLEYLTTSDDDPSPGYLAVATAERSPLREPESVSFSIPPSESVTREFDVPVSDAPDDMFGIGLHFFGDAVDQRAATEGWTELEVFGNVYAERRYNHPLAVPVEDPELIDILDNVDARLPGGLRNTPVTIPELVGETPDSPDGCDPRADAADIDKQELLDRLPDASPQAAPEPPGDDDVDVAGDGGVTNEIPDSDNATEGDRCLPFQEPPDEDMACKVTNKYDKVYIPGRILNARKGDVVLSPGSGSAIAEILMRVDPMEVYSHCGIMTDDHLELRHSTASSAWLANQTAGEFAGNEGTEGLDPEALKYAWPGTVTQSIEDAYQGSEFEAPDGNDYEIGAFSREISNTKAAGQIWPEVVKPDPRLEHDISGLRDLLTDVADEASAIDGHYRFYAYSDAAEAFEVANASVTQGLPWWDGTRGTVCSSLVWGAVQQLPDPPNLEMDDPPLNSRDLESDDDGAVVQDSTEDGLYYYFEDERKNAAQWLYDHFYSRALDESGFWGRLFTDAPDDLANQITNTFAFDWSGEDDDGDHSKDSDKWTDPGGGNAVSPDTIRNFWDAPSEDNGEIEGLYGHSERLHFRPGRVEERRVRRWERVAPEDATLSVTVILDGDAAEYTTVEVGPETEITDGNGEVELELDPASYTVHAHTEKDGWHYSQKKSVDLSPGESESVTLALEEPDEMYRLISASGTMKLLDDDWFNNPTQKKALTPKTARLGPHTKNRRLTWSQTVDGEVTGKIKMDLEWQSNADVEIDVTMELHQNGSKELDNSVSGTIPRGGYYDYWGELKSGGIDNPHAWFKGHVDNEQSPT